MKIPFREEKVYIEKAIFNIKHYMFPLNVNVSLEHTVISFFGFCTATDYTALH